MDKTYKNPPIIEAVCEFRFVLDTNFSQEQINLFYGKVKDSFPIQKKRKMHQLKFKIETEKTLEENKNSFGQESYEFEQYLSEDEKYSVQLDKGKISIHRIKPYTSWKEFSPLIQQVYKSYVDTFLPKKLERIGMRYINEVTIPSEDFSFSQYFTINASLPSLEQNKQRSIFLGFVFEQENGRDAIKVQFTEKQSEELVDIRAFILDFDYFLVNPVVSFDKIDGWLEQAHTNLENVFEGMITDDARRLFDSK